MHHTWKHMHNHKLRVCLISLSPLWQIQFISLHWHLFFQNSGKNGKKQTKPSCFFQAAQVYCPLAALSHCLITSLSNWFRGYKRFSMTKCNDLSNQSLTLETCSLLCDLGFTLLLLPSPLYFLYNLLFLSFRILLMLFYTVLSPLCYLTTAMTSLYPHVRKSQTYILRPNIPLGFGATFKVAWLTFLPAVFHHLMLKISITQFMIFLPQEAPFICYFIFSGSMF